MHFNKTYQHDDDDDDDDDGGYEIKIMKMPKDSTKSETKIKISNKEHESYNNLLLTKHIPYTKPKLTEEVRADVDIKLFSERAVFILKSHQTELMKIIEELLMAMLSSNDPTENDIYSQNQIYDVLDNLIVKNCDKCGDFCQFAKTIQGFEHNTDDDMEINPTWLVTMAEIPWLNERKVGLTSLVHTINMGSNYHSVSTLAIVLTPSKEKIVKNDVETSRNLAIVLSDDNFRSKLHEYNSEDVELVRKLFTASADKLRMRHLSNLSDVDTTKLIKNEEKIAFGFGIKYDLQRRLSYYLSDYKDTFKSKNSLIKTLTTILFLFFANLLPTIAFGMLNETNTEDKINVPVGLIAQMIGGTIFAIIGGQHLTILLTTAPLSIIILVLKTISDSFGYPFYTFYAWVGIFNAIYLVFYAFFGLSKIMKYSTRSTEETFALFISIAFIVDSVKATVKSFNSYYYGHKCLNSTISSTICTKEESLLFLILLLGTMALGLWLNNFSETPFVSSMFRRLIADFALPVSVLLMSFIGSYVFRDVSIHNFNVPHWSNITLSVPELSDLSWQGVLTAAGMAFPLSILFFMDQNISSSIVNSPMNNLKKGVSYHWDLIVVAIINAALSLFGLPWVHGALPHSPMHVQALATVEEHIDQSNHITYRVVEVVETRISSIVANIMIGLCIFLMPNPLLYIPSAVLYGLFLFMAVTGVQHNQLFERLLLLITEQSAYPPNHYLRRVPQFKVHIFTLIQFLQLLALCILGFTPIPYVKLFFPVLLLIQLPIRHKLLPKIIDKRYLEALDKAI